MAYFYLMIDISTLTLTALTLMKRKIILNRATKLLIYYILLPLKDDLSFIIFFNLSLKLPLVHSDLIVKDTSKLSAGRDIFWSTAKGDKGTANSEALSVQPLKIIYLTFKLLLIIKACRFIFKSKSIINLRLSEMIK